jgi:hypothetical protein
VERGGSRKVSCGGGCLDQISGAGAERAYAQFLSMVTAIRPQRYHHAQAFKEILYEKYDGRPPHMAIGGAGMLSSSIAQVRGSARLSGRVGTAL